MPAAAPTGQSSTGPTWLAQAHEALNAAVAAAYGWADYSPAMAIAAAWPRPWGRP